MVDNHVSFEILHAAAVTIEHAHHYPIVFDDDVMVPPNASSAHGVESDNDRRKTRKIQWKQKTHLEISNKAIYIWIAFRHGNYGRRIFAAFWILPRFCWMKQLNLFMNNRICHEFPIWIIRLNRMKLLWVELIDWIHHRPERIWTYKISMKPHAHSVSRIIHQRYGNQCIEYMAYPTRIKPFLCFLLIDWNVIFQYFFFLRKWWEVLANRLPL